MERTEQAVSEQLEKLFPNLRYGDCMEYNLQPINPDSGKKLSMKLANYLRTEIATLPRQCNLINLMWPNVEYAEDRLMVRLWLDESDRNKGIPSRRLMKPGKALRHIFPYLSDREIEIYVDRMRADLGEREYTLHVATDAESFVRAYTGEQAPYENPCTTRSRKSLASSCMRHDSISHRDDSGDMRHPVEAYASGDFAIVYLTDPIGRIGARCVVYTPEGELPVPAPVYGVCERSIDMVVDHLKSMGADFNGDWIGARLDAIAGLDGGWIAPYLDLCPQYLTHDGESLVVGRYGEIDASVYSGLLDHFESMCTCENCQARFDNDEEGTFIDDMHVCDSCYEDSNYCERTEQQTFQDGGQVVVWLHGRRREQWWSDSAIDEHATVVNGELWKTNSLYTDHAGNDITPEQLENGEYFSSDWNGEYYPSSAMCETEEGEIVSRTELDDDHGIWEQGENGIWRNVQPDLELSDVA